MMILFFDDDYMVSPYTHIKNLFLLDLIIGLGRHSETRRERMKSALYFSRETQKKRQTPKKWLSWLENAAKVRIYGSHGSATLELRPPFSRTQFTPDMTSYFGYSA